MFSSFLPFNKKMSPVLNTGDVIEFDIEKQYFGADADGSLTFFDFKELKGKYLVVVFLSRLSREDCHHILVCKEQLEKTEIVGVAKAGWIDRYLESEAGLGWKVGFPLLADEDSSLARLFRVGGKDMSTFVLDPTRRVRYIIQMTDWNKMDVIRSLVADIQLIDNEGEPEVVKEEEIKEPFDIMLETSDNIVSRNCAIIVVILVGGAMIFLIGYNVFRPNKG